MPRANNSPPSQLLSRAVHVLRTGGVVLLLSKVLGYLSFALGVRGAIRALARASRGLDVREIVDLAETFQFGDVRIKPAQIRTEIERLVLTLHERRPRTVVELGTAGGGTLFLFAQVVDPQALILSVDLPGGRFGGGYHELRAPLYRSFARHGQRVELLRGDSHSPATLETVKSLLAGRKIDFLFIDGDHSYEGVKQDFLLYSPLVGEGGLIAFHDIVPGDEELVGGVPRFWQELKGSLEVEEFVDDWGQGGFGIGLVIMRGVS